MSDFTRIDLTYDALALIVNANAALTIETVDLETQLDKAEASLKTANDSIDYWRDRCLKAEADYRYQRNLAAKSEAVQHLMDNPDV